MSDTTKINQKKGEDSENSTNLRLISWSYDTVALCMGKIGFGGFLDPCEKIFILNTRKLCSHHGLS